MDLKEVQRIDRLVDSLTATTGCCFRALPNKREAVSDLRRLAATSKAHQAAIVAAGAVPELVHRLGHSSSIVQAEAADALGSLAAGNESSAAAVVAAGAVPALAQLLAHNDSFVQKEALGALCSLVAVSEHGRAVVVAAGTVPVLVRLLAPSKQSGELQGQLQGAAACVLGHLAAGSEASRAAMMAANAVPVLVRLLEHFNSTVQEAAAALLCSLAANDEPRKAAIVAAGAVPALVQLLGHSSIDVREAAVIALHSLAADSEPSAAAVLAAGAVPRLICLLDHGELMVPDVAVGALCSLAANSEPSKAAILAADAVPRLVWLLAPVDDFGSGGVLQAGAARTLGYLAAGSEPTRAGIVAAGAVPALVQLLEHFNSSAVGAAADALCRLAAGSEAIKAAITAAGAAPALVQLLGHWADELQEAAARALCSLAAGSISSQAVLIAANAVQALERLQGHRNSSVCEAVAAALRNLPACSGAEHTGKLMTPGEQHETPRSLVDSAMADTEAEQQAGGVEAAVPTPASFDSIAAKLGMGMDFGFNSRPTDSAHPHANPGDTCSSGRSGTSRSAGSQPASSPFTTAPSCSTVKWTDLKLQDRQAGSGSYGTVLLATVEETPVAAKVLVQLRRGPNSLEAAGTLNERQLKKFHRECSLLATVRHPNIVQILWVCEDPPTIIMEYCSRGSLLDVLRQARSSPRHAMLLSWTRRLDMALDATRGILHMHNRGIAHRDLKSPNLLVDSGMRVKVADFGFSKVLDSDGSDVMSTTLNGVNPKWQAPEVLFGNPATTASDVYAMGVILWELMTWDIPWRGEVDGRVLGMKMNGQHLAIPPSNTLSTLPGTEKDKAAFQHVAAQYTQLIEQCWATEPAERPTFKDIAQRLTSIKDELAA